MKSLQFWKKPGNKLPGTVRRQTKGSEAPSAPAHPAGAGGASTEASSSPSAPSDSNSQQPPAKLEQHHSPASMARQEAGVRRSVASGSAHSSSSSSNLKLQKFHRLLNEPNMDMDALRKTSWSGIPDEVRGTVWQLLLGYLPANRNRRQDTLDKRRREYQSYLNQYYSIDESARSENETHILKQISVDVPRTSPGIKWIQNPKLQKSLERMLYIWSIRHPASGYVQGINDLATPFYLAFCSTSTNTPIEAEFEEVIEQLGEEQLTLLEADCYWCMTMLLDGIQDHYTFAQPGIQRMVFKLKELIARIDDDLHSHFDEQGLQFIQFAFRWMNCLLMRELSLTLIIRLWDTYLSEESGDGFKVFHIYTCAAFLMGFADQLKGMEFQDLVLFLQSLPTANWGVQDVETMLSQAYIYHTLFHASPRHLQ